MNVRSWWGAPWVPRHTSSQASFLGSHPIQPPKVLTGGIVILVLQRGRHARPWWMEGCTWLKCPDRPTGDRQHRMPQAFSSSVCRACAILGSFVITAGKLDWRSLIRRERTGLTELGCGEFLLWVGTVAPGRRAWCECSWGSGLS